MSKLELPKSVTNQWINCTGLLIGGVACAVALSYHLHSIAVAFISAFAYALPIILLEILILKTPYRPTTGLSRTQFNINIDRASTKLIGFYVTLTMLMLLYCFIPEYYKPQYKSFLQVLPYGFGILSLIALPYFIIVDAKSTHPYDAYWYVGRKILFQSTQPPEGHIPEPHLYSQFVLSWMIKGFFLPLMFSYFLINVDICYGHKGFNLFENLHKFMYLTIILLFMVDLLIAIVGYVTTLKLLDSHTRMADPTSLGWMVCLICYEPFNMVFFSPSTIFLFYSEPTSWTHNTTLLVIWATITLFLLFFYAMATVAFGIRFSNLTHRGIITNGMYRFTKHPAYFSKTFFWWVSSLPFIFFMGAIFEGIQNILILCLHSFIYYKRAKAEERMLSKDETYVQYALWMNEHGVFSVFNKWLPFLKYKHP